MKHSTKIRIPSTRAVLQQRSGVILSAMLCVLAGCPEVDPEDDTDPSPVSMAGSGGKDGGKTKTAGTGGAAAPSSAKQPVKPPIEPVSPPPAPAGELTCDECLDQKCQAKWTACQNNTTCAELVECRNACADGDSACTDGCYEEFAGGIPLLRAFVDCGTSMCQICLDDPEPMPDPRPMVDAMGGRMPDPPQTCGDCLVDRCDTQWTTCQNNTTCADLVDCRGECADGDTACLEGCSEEFAGGVPLLRAFVDCGTSMCQVCLDEPDPVACVVEDPTGWTEGPVWTEAELEACLDECDTDMCVEETCEDGEEFLDCARSTNAKCAGDPGGECRREYEPFRCCIDACAEESADEAALTACIDRDCPTERDAWFDCLNDADCTMQARAACVVGPL